MNTAIETMEWFDEWFNTPYYHILYKNHDRKEAEFFIDHLIEHFSMKSGDRILDLACGKGRYSVYLNQKGLDVEGIDLSEKSIQYAQQFENDRLHFYRHDMRDRYKADYFNFVINVFTSFGYFKTEEEDLEAIKTISHTLQKGGILILDYFNTEMVKSALPKKQTIFRDDIEFHIHKYFKDRFVYKNIQFEADGMNNIFTERVEALHVSDFKRYFSEAGLELVNIYGDYAFDEFEEDNSSRMILIARKL